MLNTALKRLIFAHKAAGGEVLPINEYTATGNPAEFSTNLARPLTKFEIPFTPVQTGTGDPSPSNVRPIAGWNDVTVNSNGNQIPVEWESIAGTVYGGTLNLVTGVLTLTHSMTTIAQLNGWMAHNNTASRQAWKTFDIDIKQPQSSNAVVNCISDKFASVSFSATWKPWNISCGETNGTGILICVPSGAYDSADEMVADLGDTQLCYELLTPQTIQIPPVAVRTIIGQNSIGTNTNGTNTIKYLKRG